MDETKLSVVLPVYNGGRYLAGAIQNILTQSYTNLELVIVDDASRDNSSEIINSVIDSRVVRLRHEINQGLPTALNTGFANATGEYLTWTSDDNLYAPNALKILADVLDVEEQVGLVYADYWEINEQGEVTRRIHLCSPEKLMEINCVGACFLYRRSVLETVGDYDLNARLVEDWDYWLRVSQGFQMKHLSVPLYYYRLHPASLTSQEGIRHHRWRVITRIRRRRFGWPWWRYWREMARIDFDEAFARFGEGNYRPVGPLALKAVVRNPALLMNFGMIKMVAQSLSRSFRGGNSA